MTSSPFQNQSIFGSYNAFERTNAKSPTRLSTDPGTSVDSLINHPNFGDYIENDQPYSIFNQVNLNF